jgi:hypothetical protein
MNNGNETWFVDSGYDKTGKFELEVHILVVEEGRHDYSMNISRLSNVHDGASKLAELVNENRPQRVILNKVGISLTLYETFHEILESFNIITLSDGTFAFNN